MPPIRPGAPVLILNFIKCSRSTSTRTKYAILRYVTRRRHSISLAVASRRPLTQGARASNSSSARRSYRVLGFPSGASTSVDKGSSNAAIAIVRDISPTPKRMYRNRVVGKEREKVCGKLAKAVCEVSRNYCSSRKRRQNIALGRRSAYGADAQAARGRIRDLIWPKSRHLRTVENGRRQSRPIANNSARKVRGSRIRLITINGKYRGAQKYHISWRRIRKSRLAMLIVCN